MIATSFFSGFHIAFYLDDPKDAMNLTVTFSRLPDGWYYRPPPILS